MTPYAELPNAGQSPEHAASPLRSRRPGVGAREKVAMLEDDVAFREAVREFLEESGYEVVFGQSGMDGVYEVIGGNCDVILCDMMMPSISGDMFFKAVERLRPDLCERFVFMTGYRGFPKIHDFLAQVRGTVLLKPFSMDDLLEVIAFVQVRAAVRGLT